MSITPPPSNHVDVDVDARRSLKHSGTWPPAPSCVMRLQHVTPGRLTHRGPRQGGAASPLANARVCAFLQYDRIDRGSNQKNDKSGRFVYSWFRREPGRVILPSENTFCIYFLPCIYFMFSIIFLPCFHVYVRRKQYTVAGAAADAVS